jgi:protein-L-isoaspartate(D-aspartate) O-methyltransferase
MRSIGIIATYGLLGGLFVLAHLVRSGAVLYPQEEKPLKDSQTGKPDKVQQRYAKQRAQMVKEQLEARDITDKKVLKAMGKVPRHIFVPKDMVKYAYADGPLPIGCGQTISQPYMVALMTQALKLEGDEKVLEIGTGSGYQAAVLAKIVKKVYTIEIIDELHKRASKVLKQHKYSNVYTKKGDGYYGWKEHAPYDAIIVTAAASHVPPPLLKQLKDGGILVIPLGSPLLFQTLTIIKKKKGNKLETEYSVPCRFVPMTGKIQEKR